MRIPERTPEWLRRIHSLTGMIPLGAFLLEHIAVNSTALGGPPAFRATVAALRSVPGVIGLEVLGIGLPLLIHVAIGILIATELREEGNPDASGWMTWSQRLTGIYLLNYVVFHVWGTRLSPELLRRHHDLFAIMHEQVQGIGGYLFNLVGVLAAAWHLGLGWPRFVVRWWPWASPRRLRVAAVAGFLLSAALGVAGVASLSAFARARP